MLESTFPGARLHVRPTVIGLLVAGLLAVSSIGCGPAAPEGNNVSGTVSFKGNPLPAGSILFSPDSSKGNSGPAVSLPIVDGQYDTKPANKRLQVGAYRVRINGFDGNADPDSELPRGLPLFKEFNTTVDLPEGDALSTDFEVK